MVSDRSAPGPNTTRLQWALVLLLSLSLLSFSHSCCIDGHDAGSLISVAELTCSAADNCAKDKTPAAPMAHPACHCLSHAGTIVPDGIPSPDQPRAETLLAATAYALNAADPTSPFKPPRV